MVGRLYIAIDDGNETSLIFSTSCFGVATKLIYWILMCSPTTDGISINTSKQFSSP
jgi:hypothetical protein